MCIESEDGVEIYCVDGVEIFSLIKTNDEPPQSQTHWNQSLYDSLYDYMTPQLLKPNPESNINPHPNS